MSMPHSNILLSVLFEGPGGRVRRGGSPHILRGHPGQDEPAAAAGPDVIKLLLLRQNAAVS